MKSIMHLGFLIISLLTSQVSAHVDITALIKQQNLTELAERIGNSEQQWPVNGRDGVVPLIIAAQNNAVTSLRWLLQHDANTEARSHSGSTALAMAAYYGHLESVALLIEAKANLAARSPNGYQAIDWAFENQQFSAVEQLMWAWARQQISGESERQLLNAIENNQAINIVYENSFTSFPLILAIAKNDLNLVSTLLQRGFNPNQNNAAAYAPLPFASRLGNEAMIALLLKHKADPNLGGSKGNDIAGPLNQAARGSRVGAAKLLIAAGADVNRGNAKGVTPLYICAVADTDSGELTRLLLSNGAQLRQQADDGYDTLDVAVENRNRLFVKIALQHLLDQSLSSENSRLQLERYRLDAKQTLPKISDESRLLLLNVAIVNADNDLFARSIKNKIALDSANRSGHSPLSLAASWGEADMVAALLQQGANVNSQNDNRYSTSALMESTRDGHVAITEQLIAAGAKINLLDKHHDHALNWAVFFGHAPLVKLLLNHRADVSQVGQQTHDNALDIAKRRRFPEIISLLEAAGAKATK